MNKEVIVYNHTADILSDVRSIIESAQIVAHHSINIALLQRNWLLGKRIAEEELQGKDRAEYGASIIKNLSKELTDIYGKGFTKSNLYSFYSFYKSFPQIFQSPIGKSPLLSWTHYLTLLQVADEQARKWYETEAANETWSVRTLQRNISSQYYYRLLKSQNDISVKNEMQELTAPYQTDKLEFKKTCCGGIFGTTRKRLFYGKRIGSKHYRQLAKISYGTR